MKILHICNDYCGSKVHANLYRELDRFGMNQTVFTCYRGYHEVGTNSFEAQHTDFIYRGVLSTKHRIFFHLKIKKVYKELLDAVNIQEYNIIHAITLFTDGAVAYRVYKDYGIPYIITVRNTDINEFMYVAPHTWRIGMKVLLNAQKIIFISKAPMESFCRHFLVKWMLPKIKERFIMQPNGLDDFWLDHLNKGIIRKNCDIIYVGRFDWNKNVIRLAEAVLALKNEFGDIRLHLVGGDGDKEKKIIEIEQTNKDCIICHGKIYDKNVLRELYNQCSIFAMPSIHETFGLVYIEAMSQNLAVLYTRNQGIDGLFDSRIGEAVNALSVESIKDGLRKLLKNRTYYDFQDSVDFEQFRWERIALRYKNIYDTFEKANSLH